MQVLFNKVEPVVKAAGYQLWWVRWLSGRTLQVFIDSPDGILLKDCEKVSRELSAWLDVMGAEMAAPARYNLQVSSPGSDRELHTADQYNQYLGQKVLCTLHQSHDGKRRYKGILRQANQTGIALSSGATLQQFTWNEISQTRVEYDPREDLNRH